MTIKYLTVPHLNIKDLTRIFSKINIDPAITWNGSPCWNWIGCNKNGYGQIGWKTRETQFIYRVIFAWLIHPLPRGQGNGELDHLCRNHSCCSPLHLEFVDSQTNTRRGFSPSGINSRKTHCINNHPLSGDNLYLIDNDPDKRQCKRCHRQRKSTLQYKDKAKERRAVYSTENRIHLNAKQQEWRMAHREHRNAQAREYYHKKKLA